MIKKVWEASRVVITKTKLSDNKYRMECVSSSFPLWATVFLTLVEVAGAGYATVKGYQGTKHLLKPDYPPAESMQTHIRVKRPS